ncbi:hypothetical protein DR62_06400 [Burkholderia thailandensis]|nr:hypothetical protein DR62_06400 [Burkholderia thailandensis]AOI52529.1 hypothetical protein WI24_12480 [Burkholderia thailandensis]AOJ51488.1 hypothetical protein AQ475_12155 [Burkholderia thailandensis]
MPNARARAGVTPAPDARGARGFRRRIGMSVEWPPRRASGAARRRNTRSAREPRPIPPRGPTDVRRRGAR